MSEPPIDPGEPVASSRAGDPAAARLGAWMRRVAQVRDPPAHVRRWLLLVGGATFLGGAALAARTLDLPPGGVRVGPMVVVGVVLVPLTIAVNAVELIALGRLLDQRLPVATAVRVVVLGTAANLLPFPGAAALRIQALAGGGASYPAATGVNVGAAVAWLGSALVVAGAALGTLEQVGAAAGALLVGTLALVGAWTVLRRLAADEGVTALALLLAAEVATVVTHALRLVLLLGAVGAEASFAAGTVVGTSGPLAAAAGVFPAGLGIAESLAVAAGALVAVSAAPAFAAAALNRVIGYGVLGAAAIIPAVRRGRAAPR